jgi:hypothetical protein
MKEIKLTKIFLILILLVIIAYVNSCDTKCQRCLGCVPSCPALSYCYDMVCICINNYTMCGGTCCDTRINTCINQPCNPKWTDIKTLTGHANYVFLSYFAS